MREDIYIYDVSIFRVLPFQVTAIGKQVIASHDSDLFARFMRARLWQTLWNQLVSSLLLIHNYVYRILAILITHFPLVSYDCPTGWRLLDEKCYLFGTEEMDYQSAENFCNSGTQGYGHLTSILTEREQSFVTGNLIW